MFNNKKAIEISINFIVILVLAIFVFSLSVWFITSVMKTSVELHEKSSADLDAQIGYLNCGTTPVCLNMDELELSRGEDDAFGLRLYNYKDEDITIQVTVDMDDQVLSKALPKDNFKVLFGIEHGKFKRVVHLKRNEEKPVGIGIIANDDAPSGKYLIKVETKYCNGSNWCTQPFDFGDGFYLLYIDVP
tara:strand:+ start:4323 stop:4889 length:567 start_codon:yes stop_codon:yes gene_type:complete